VVQIIALIIDVISIIKERDWLRVFHFRIPNM